MIPHPKEKYPNVKMDELFWWCCHICREAWVLAENFYIYKQNCKIQRKSENKTRYGKFKSIGDGIQADCISDGGFTYDFYFRNYPVDHKWIDKCMCPIHSCLLQIFGNLMDAGHKYKM